MMKTVAKEIARHKWLTRIGIAILVVVMPNKRYRVPTMKNWSGSQCPAEKNGCLAHCHAR